jgi:acyl-CoA thioester hydrolase
MATEHVYTTQILEGHLDTFGHVNNARYLNLLEEARWQWITDNGFGLAEIQRHKLGPTILEIDIKFRRELQNRERITIRTTVLEYSGKVGKLKQVIEKEDGSIAAEAVLVSGLFDMKERKLVLPTPEWRRALGLGE